VVPGTCALAAGCKPNNKPVCCDNSAVDHSRFDKQLAALQGCSTAQLPCMMFCILCTLLTNSRTSISNPGCYQCQLHAASKSTIQTGLQTSPRIRSQGQLMSERYSQPGLLLARLPVWLQAAPA
jgi:hypothetical protein